jgi:hypothetical protein
MNIFYVLWYRNAFISLGQIPQTGVAVLYSRVFEMSHKDFCVKGFVASFWEVVEP